MRWKKYSISWFGINSRTWRKLLMSRKCSKWFNLLVKLLSWRAVLRLHLCFSSEKLNLRTFCRTSKYQITACIFVMSRTLQLKWTGERFGTESMTIVFTKKKRSSSCACLTHEVQNVRRSKFPTTKNLSNSLSPKHAFAKGVSIMQAQPKI